MGDAYVRNHNHTLRFQVAGAGIKAGTITQVAGISGVVAGLGSDTPKGGEYAVGEWAELNCDIVAEVNSATATTFTAGGPVQWDDTNKLAVATGDFPLGVALRDKANGDTSVWVVFNRVATA